MEDCHIHGEKWDRIPVLSSDIDDMMRALKDPKLEAIEGEKRALMVIASMTR